MAYRRADKQSPQPKSHPLTPLTVLVMTSTLLFLLTVLMGVWAAYELATALRRCAVLVAGLLVMVSIAWAGRYHAKTTLGLAGVGCALGAGGLSFIYGLRLYDNGGAVASALMVLLPLGACGVWWQWLRQQKRLARLAGGALSLALLVFGLTLERTAWLGLSGGVIGAAYIAWRFAATTAPVAAVRRVSDWLLGLGVLSGFVLYGLLFFTPALDRLFGQSAIGATFQERAALWQESLAMCREYYFTGSGLGMTAMVYSTYVLAMRVPYWYHAHHLYLQLTLEQGVPGLIAFLGMTLPLLGSLVLTYRTSGPYSRWFCLATITALLAVVTYGLLDAELYATSIVVVLFVPCGFALALYWALLNRQAEAGQAPHLRHSLPVVGGAGMMPVLALVMLCLWPGAGEKLDTNLGVLAQTKAELSLYRWPIWSIQDELRRRHAVDLSVAMAYYQAALTLDPANATAHQRLGQIALSQRNYPAALDHLRQAYNADPKRASIHRLLGEVYAVTGDVTRAATLWQSIEVQPGQISDRLWWYGSLNAQQEVRWIQQALVKSRL